MSYMSLGYIEHPLDIFRTSLEICAVWNFKTAFKNFARVHPGIILFLLTIIGEQQQ